MRAFFPNMIPEGLRKNISASGIAEISRPSIREAFPPVTRLIMVEILSGPLKVALSPLLILNSPKL